MIIIYVCVHAVEMRAVLNMALALRLILIDLNYPKNEKLIITLGIVAIPLSMYSS